MQKILASALETLKSGGTLLYPTDTIWGLGCDATNETAVKKIIDIKHRDDKKSFIILVADINDIGKYVKDVPELAWDLAEFSEKPLTIIYPQAVGLAKNVVNEDGSIAIRLVKTGFCYELIKKLRKPLVSTSANISGEPSPTSLESIPTTITGAVDFIADVPADGTGQPSSILKMEVNGEIKFLRR